MTSYNFRRLHIDLLTAHDPDDYLSHYELTRSILLDLLHECPHATARDSAVVRVIEIAAENTIEQLVTNNKDELLYAAAMALGMEDVCGCETTEEKEMQKKAAAHLRERRTHPYGRRPGITKPTCAGRRAESIAEADVVGPWNFNRQDENNTCAKK
jgi:hypothetical protein